MAVLVARLVVGHRGSSLLKKIGGEGKEQQGLESSVALLKNVEVIATGGKAGEGQGKKMRSKGGEHFCFWTVKLERVPSCIARTDTQVPVRYCVSSHATIRLTVLSSPQKTFSCMERTWEVAPSDDQDVQDIGRWRRNFDKDDRSRRCKLPEVKRSASLHRRYSCSFKDTVIHPSITEPLHKPWKIAHKPWKISARSKRRKYDPLR